MMLLIGLTNAKLICGCLPNHHILCLRTHTYMCMFIYINVFKIKSAKYCKFIQLYSNMILNHFQFYFKQR